MKESRVCMQLLFLGTGAGMPSKQRNTSALALKMLEERGAVWLFDCGEATQHQILKSTIKPRKIEKVFITHMHGDHIFGLPGFLASRSFQGSSEAIEIYGPSGIKEYVDTMMRLSRTHLSYTIIYHELREGTVFEDELMMVEARLLDHVIPCFGFRITQKPLPPKLRIERARELNVPNGPLLAKLKNGEDVVLEDGTTVRSEEVTDSPQAGWVAAILGDTRFCQAAVELARDADVLVHEATFDAETEKLAGEYGHSTMLDAALTAQQAKAAALIVNHISARFLPEDEKFLLNQVKEVHPETYIAHDLQEFSWNQVKRKISKYR